MMTIQFGPISRVVTHLETADPDTRDAMLTLCKRAGTVLTMQVGELHTTTYEPVRVTCQECLEWMHA